MSVIQLRGDIGSEVYYEFDNESRPLGEGGMGIVYRGIRISPEGRRVVAIKCIKDGLATSVIERARREASIRIKNDNLIEMIDFIEADVKDVLGMTAHQYFIVSELVMGVSLDDILEGRTNDQNGQSVPAAVEMYSLMQNNRYRFALKVVSNVLKGLIALHGAGYIHRDIDPTNIMVTAEGHIKLIDFGIAKQFKSLGTLDKALTSVGEFIGKPTYASPELILGDVKSQQETTDIYAVGILFYQLLTGTPPFAGTHQEVIKAHINKKLPLNKLKHKASADVIKKACEKEHNNRYRSAAEFLVEVDRLYPKRYPDPAPNYALWALIASGVVLVGVVAFLMLRKNTPSSEFTGRNFNEIQALLSNPGTFNAGLASLDSIVDQAISDETTILTDDHVKALKLRADLYRDSVGYMSASLKAVRDAATKNNLKLNSDSTYILHNILAERQPTKEHYILVATDHYEKSSAQLNVPASQLEHAAINAAKELETANQYLDKAKECLENPADSVRVNALGIKIKSLAERINNSQRKQ